MNRNLFAAILIVGISCNKSTDDEPKMDYYVLDGVEYSISPICSGSNHPTVGSVFAAGNGTCSFTFFGSLNPPTEGNYNVVGTFGGSLGDVYVIIQGNNNFYDYLGNDGTISVTWTNNRPIFKFTNVKLKRTDSGLISTLTGQFKCP